jgi:hypothetical protein
MTDQAEDWNRTLSEHFQLRLCTNEGKEFSGGGGCGGMREPELCDQIRKCKLVITWQSLHSERYQYFFGGVIDEL